MRQAAAASSSHCRHQINVCTDTERNAEQQLSGVNYLHCSYHCLRVQTSQTGCLSGTCLLWDNGLSMVLASPPTTQSHDATMVHHHGNCDNMLWKQCMTLSSWVHDIVQLQTLCAMASSLNA